MVITKSFSTSVKPTFLVQITVKSSTTVVDTILDTGTVKSLWFGTKGELEDTGAVFVDNDGSYVNANGSIVKNRPIYRLNFKIRSDIGNFGFNLRNVDVILVNDAGISRKKYKMLIPYILLNRFNLCLYSARHAAKLGNNSELKDFYKFGYITIDTLENVVNYNVKSVNGTPVDIRELCKDDEVLDID